MRYSLVTAAAAFAALSLAEAVPAPQNGQVRYYFPREIKRQLLNDLGLGGGSNSSSTSSSTDLIDQLASGLKQAQSTTGSSGSDSGSAATTTPAGGISIGQNTVITSSSPTSTDSSDPSGTPTATDDSNTPSSTPGNILTNLLPTQTQTSDPSNTATASSDSTTPGLQITPSPTDTAGITGPTTAPTNTDIVTPSNTDSGIQITPTLTSGLLPTSLTDIITPPASTPTASTDPTSPVSSDPVQTSGITGPPTGITTSDPGTVPPTTTPIAPVTTPTDVLPPTSTPINTGSTDASPTPTGTPLTSAATDTALSSPPITSGTPIVPTSALTTPLTNAQSISPTATNTDTALSQASSIVSATSASETSGAPTTSASTIPSSLPRIIVSPDPQTQATANNDSLQLVQLGFTYGLNYPFVVSNTWAIQQIFNFLPPGIANGINTSNSDVIVQYLQPLNTLSRTGYITTLAMAKIPIKDVNSLSVALLNPKAELWNNKNVTIRTLVNMLDPTIPLLAGQSLGDGNPVNSANNAGTSGKGGSGGAAGTDDSTGNSSVKPSSIGIGLGVVGGAALYGVAMFMVAKRYKKRKNAHKRASSVQSGSSNGSQARETNTLMAGARNSYGSRGQPQMAQAHHGGRESRTSDRSGQSGRTYISPPVMAENSLGWN